MTTGTTGDDDLTNLSSTDTVDALDGDDIITIDPFYLPSPGQIFVDGGNGVDALLAFTVTVRGTGSAGAFHYEEDADYFGTVGFANIELLAILADFWGGGLLVTGDSHDFLSIGDADLDAGPVRLQTLGGDDEVEIFGFHYGAVIDLGSGDDYVDLSFVCGCAGAGAFIVSGGDGFNFLVGTDESSLYDILSGGAGSDILIGLYGDDRLLGGDDSDVLDSGEGNDLLDGGAGADLLIGCFGDDRYFVTAGDEIVEYEGEGLDIAYARTDYVLTADAYVELLGTADGNGTTPINLTGNELANTIQGNAGANRLLGMDGDDYLVGLGGNDRLDGGAGLDILDGGAGDDRYFVDLGDRVRERPGEGLDIAYARTDYVLNAGAQIELLAAISGIASDPINLTGNELANTIQGNAGDNVLAGAGGIDFLTGFGGADTFRYFSASDSLMGAADRLGDFETGIDKIDLSLIDANPATRANDAFTFIGSSAFSGQAGELRLEQIGNRYHVTADLNGDGIADMQIIAHAPVAGPDLIL